jgi:two-component system cell cycle response regulator DivK
MPGNIRFSDKLAKEPDHESSCPKGAGMAKILYIEDIEDNLTLVQRIVTSQGHEFFQAKNAEQGLEMALTNRPDLILLDLGLPDSDGQTLSVWLRSEPVLENVPIIVLTAWPEEVAKHTVEAYGLDGYLCKPISLTNLVQVIDDALTSKSI